MTPESSPFRPGQPVPAELFVGRRDEIERIRGMVGASTQGRFKIGFVSGERGIGKSSLVNFVRRLSEQDRNTAGCHVFLGGVKDVREMLRRIFDSLLKESVDKPWHQELRRFFGDRVSKVGLFGVSLELRLKEGDLSAIERDFLPSMRHLLASIEEHKRSLFLILDDVNGLAGSDEFAHWLKSSVDEIATAREETRLCILVAGLEERRQELAANQPSLARVFDLIEIRPWSDDEVLEFYRNSFHEGHAKVSAEGLRTLVRFTGGLPVLAHEIGDAVWRTARTEEIEDDEVYGGIVSAAGVIGRKLLEPGIFREIRSERYRAILRKIADEPRTHFTRAEILERLTGAEGRVLDNFLRRMRTLGALEQDPEVQGGYRFSNNLHAVYFWMESQAALPG